MAIPLLRNLLVNIIEGMDNGTFTCTPEEQKEAYDILSNMLIDKKPMSKQAVMDYLHINSSATFERRIREGKIPQGRKLKGFKELIWYKSDLNHYK